MKSNRTKKVLAMIFVASIAVIIGTISYAFFAIDMSDSQNQSLFLEAGTMRLRFADNDNGINAQLNFGESVTKLFVIENTGTLDAIGKINFTSMINTYLRGSLTYKLEMFTTENSDTWIEVQSSRNVPQSSSPSTSTLAKNLEIPVGATYYYRLTITLENLPDIDQTQDLNATFTTQFNLEDGVNRSTVFNLTDAVFDITNGDIPDNVNTESPNFAKAAITDEGVYAIEDDYGTSYYYRGASENNYVKYGQDKNGNDMYWRIIRINGDGSVRIIYDGTQAYANGVANNTRYAITNQPFNAQYTDAKYVGWMFGGAQGEASTSKAQAQTNETNSDAKTAVDNWYKENIVDTGYANNVADVIFCNDRTTPGSAASYWTSDTGLGYANNAIAYGAYARLGVQSSNPRREDPQPKFTCEVKNDAFTVNETDKGNGALTYPVGLITADEIVVAGSGKYDTANSSYYLYKSSSYYGLSLSPYNVYTNGYAAVFLVGTLGHLSSVSVYNSIGAVAPVINLSAEYAITLIGDGSMSNPYRAPGVTA